MENFIGSVHVGFMKAQKLIIQNLLLLLKEKRKLRLQIKQMNICGQKEEKKEVNRKLKRNQYQQMIMRKLADSILWQLLKMDETIVKSLYRYNPLVDISHSNLEYDLNRIEEIFEKDNTSFPLLCDLTTSAQVSDVIISDYDRQQIFFLELKEGKVNEKIEQILDDYNKSNCDRYLQLELENKDKNFQNQFNRFIKQKVVMTETVENLNNGLRYDKNMDIEVKIHDKEIKVNYFNETLDSLIDQVTNKNYAIDCIEECLYIGVYKTTKMNLSPVFEGWMESIGNKSTISNIIAGLYSPISTPLFLLPLSNKSLSQIIKGEITVLMSLDVLKWYELIKRRNVDCRWMSKKETNKLMMDRYTKPIIHSNRAFEVKVGESKIVAYQGLLARMIYDLMMPNSAIDYLLAIENYDELN